MTHVQPMINRRGDRAMNTKKRMQEKTKSYFDKEAKEYDSSSDGKFVKCMYSEIVSRVMELQGRKILDLGCGNGNVIRMLQENREAEYSGVDISEAMIREAQKRVGKGVELKAADAAALPYSNDIFEIIICNASFHHYTDPVIPAVSILQPPVKQPSDGANRNCGVTKHQCSPWF